MTDKQPSYELVVRRNDPNLKPAEPGVTTRLSACIFMIDLEYNLRSIIDIHVVPVRNGDEKAALKKLRFLASVYDGYFDNFTKSWRAAVGTLAPVEA